MDRILQQGGVTVAQQLVGLTDAAGNPITPAGGYLGAPYSDQQLATPTATALTAQAVKNGVIVKASDTNAGKVLVGGSAITSANDGSGVGFYLSPGESAPFACGDASQIYVVLASGNTSSTDFVAALGN